ncbi:MAG: MFS transporter [Oceanospirillaceae bacterium]|nr:MFS transporter [Oceanospirillaceae bacterium]
MSSGAHWGPVARPIHAYLLLLCGCMSVLAAVVIAPILPKMQAHFADIERVEFLVPLALTTPGLVIALLSLFVGVIADKFGRKRLLVGGLAFYALFGCAPLLIDSLHAIIATRIGVGFTEAIIMTCCTALIGDYYRGLQRERYLALNTTFASTSAVIFIAVGGALGEFGWRVPFGVYSISLLLALAALMLLWEPRRHVDQAAMSHTVEAEDDESWNPMRLLGICLVTLVGGVLFMAVQVHVAYLLADVGVESSATVGLIASAAQVAVVVGSLLFRLILRAGYMTSMRLGVALLLIGCGYLLIGVSDHSTGVIVGALINGLGAGILLPTLLCWNMKHLPDQRRALGTGAWMAAFFLGQFLTPLVVVGLSERAGGFSAAFQSMGYVVVPMALLLVLVRPLFRPRKCLNDPLLNEHP